MNKNKNKNIYLEFYKEYYDCQRSLTLFDNVNTEDFWEKFLFLNSQSSLSFQIIRYSD